LPTDCPNLALIQKKLPNLERPFHLISSLLGEPDAESEVAFIGGCFLFAV
jgi:hypothetical protein